MSERNQIQKYDDETSQRLREIQRFRGLLALFFDVETSGLPNSGPPSKQPYITQLAWCLAVIPMAPRGQYREVSYSSTIFSLPHGVTVDESAAKVTGIDTAMCKEFGVDHNDGITVFESAVAQADLLVAHNFAFDRGRVQDALYRSGQPPESQAFQAHIEDKSIICTMNLTRGVVQLPATPRMKASGRFGFKTPKLEESHRHLMGEEFDGAHDAMNDVRATMRVLRAAMDLGERLSVGGLKKL